MGLTATDLKTIWAQRRQIYSHPVAPREQAPGVSLVGIASEVYRQNRDNAYNQTASAVGSITPKVFSTAISGAGPYTLPSTPTPGGLFLVFLDGRQVQPSDAGGSNYTLPAPNQITVSNPGNYLLLTVVYT